MGRTRTIALMAVLVALAWALGLIFMHIPNVELITFAVFVSGYLVGAKRGAVVGGAAMALYSGLNPMGAPFPPVFAAQVAAMAFVGLIGGVSAPWFEHLGRRQRLAHSNGGVPRRYIGAAGSGASYDDTASAVRAPASGGGASLTAGSRAGPAGLWVALSAGALGFALTAIYQAGVIVGFALSSPELEAGLVAALASNAFFSIVHIASNTAVFAILAPLTLVRLRRFSLRLGTAR